MIFLDPSTQFVVGRTCGDEEFVRRLDLLEKLVRQDIDGGATEGSVEDAEPAGDDFRTFFSLSTDTALEAKTQIRTSCELRRISPSYAELLADMQTGTCQSRVRRSTISWYPDDICIGRAKLLLRSGCLC
jgi:hypothetical protein